MRQVLRAALAVATFSILSSTGIAIAAPPKALFASDDMLHLTLRGPLTNIPRGLADKPVSGQLTVEGAAPESLPVELSVRGITRRKREICSFPPLRVEFTDKPGAASIFKGQKRLKLVTHCQQSKSYQQYVLLEYAAYRLYNVLTPESFKARLAQIDYRSEDGSSITTRLGFFIEDIDDVAHRNEHERLRGVKSITVPKLNAAAAARFAVFEYMISNLDWSMTAAPPGDDCCHNSRLVGAKDATADILPVPYDFDYAGLVNAPYAVPPAGISVANVRIRRYRGFCAHNEQAKAFAGEILARRASLLAILDATPQLEDGSRQRADSYLGDFFNEMGSPSKVAELMNGCLR
jgi:hypothetical protein